MKIKIPSRNNIPECELYVEFLRKSADTTIPLGRERPVMFMLPGGPGGNHTVYDSIKMSLFNYVDIVLIDPRGCGLSSPSEARFCEMEESVKDIEALRQELGIEKFILFGGSYGAMVSLCYAIANSEHLQGLILVAGAPSGECFDTALETLRKIGTEEQIALTEKLFAGKIESVDEKEKFYSIMRNIYLAKAKEDVLDKKNIPTIGKKLPYFLELSNFGHSTILPNYNVVNDLHKIQVPTLLLAGERDWINNVKYAYQMHGLIPNSELVVFPEAGHFIWQGIEDQFYEKIATFILNRVLVAQG
jgi:proline iminopeptidase